MSGFRIHSDSIRRFQLLPMHIPWALVADHEKQAQSNHGQTLERLNQRGGLTLCELKAVICGYNLTSEHGYDDAKCVNWFFNWWAAKALESDATPPPAAVNSGRDE